MAVSTEGRDFLSDEAKALLESMDMSNDARQTVGVLVDSLAEKYNLREGELDIRRLGHDTLDMIVGTEYVGTIDTMDLYSNLVNDPRTDNAIEAMHELKDIEPDLKDNEIYKAVMANLSKNTERDVVEVMKELEQEKNDIQPESVEPEVIPQATPSWGAPQQEVKAEKEDFVTGNDNKTFDDTDKLPKWLQKQIDKTEHMKEKLDKQLAKEEKREAKREAKEEKRRLNPSAFDKRREAVNRYKELKVDINARYDKLQNELSIAKMNGYTAKDAEYFSNEFKNVYERSFKAVEARQEIPSMGATIAKAAAEKSEELKESTKAKASPILNKLKTYLDIKIEAGREVLGRAGEAVHNANQKAFAVGKSAYAGLSENLHSMVRGYKQIDRGLGILQERAYKSLYQVAETAFERSGDVKTAIGNVGRAMAGKEALENPGYVSNAELNVLSRIQAHINENVERNNQLAEDISLSAAVSVVNMASVQENREASGINRSSRMDDKIAAARQKVSYAKEHRSNANPHAKDSRSDDTSKEAR
ncbi:MAG: hypothetical protein J5525_13205 [Lachnospiraceae bacterium]|nr:hypothetical protein [Lachnospiraceae bacterium]